MPHPVGSPRRRFDFPSSMLSTYCSTDSSIITAVCWGQRDQSCYMFTTYKHATDYPIKHGRKACATRATVCCFRMIDCSRAQTGTLSYCCQSSTCWEQKKSVLSDDGTYLPLLRRDGAVEHAQYVSKYWRNTFRALELITTSILVLRILSVFFFSSANHVEKQWFWMVKTLHSRSAYRARFIRQWYHIRYGIIWFDNYRATYSSSIAFLPADTKREKKKQDSYSLFNK